MALILKPLWCSNFRVTIVGIILGQIAAILQLQLWVCAWLRRLGA